MASDSRMARDDSRDQGRSGKRAELLLVACVLAIVAAAALLGGFDEQEAQREQPEATGAPTAAPDETSAADGSSRAASARAAASAREASPDGRPRRMPSRDRNSPERTQPEQSAQGPERPAQRPDSRGGVGRDASSPVLWVKPEAEVALRDAPRGERVETVGRRTDFGSPTVFSIVERRPDSTGRWAGVTTPHTPNSELGWVRLDPRRVETGSVAQRIEVDLSERRASLYEDGRELRSFSVTIGAPDSPTPTGRFAITDTFLGGLDPVYGCCALALSANQPLRPSGWLGGRRIAFHGTSGALGVAASNGCIRASEGDLRALIDTVELGTPVRIRG